MTDLEAENSRLKSILREERDRHRQKNHGGSSDDRCNVCQRLDVVGDAGLRAWKPIDTAPKDGTSLLVFDEGAILISQWVQDDGEGKAGWYDYGIMEPPPTHWMPLPDPPRGEQA